jgi:hypothetical protein
MNDSNELKQVIRTIQTQLPSTIPSLFLKIRKVSASFPDAYPIWVAPKCHDEGGLACLYRGGFG